MVVSQNEFVHEPELRNPTNPLDVDVEYDLLIP